MQTRRPGPSRKRSISGFLTSSPILCAAATRPFGQPGYGKSVGGLNRPKKALNRHNFNPGPRGVSRDRSGGTQLETCIGLLSWSDQPLPGWDQLNDREPYWLEFNCWVDDRLSEQLLRLVQHSLSGHLRYYPTPFRGSVLWPVSKHNPGQGDAYSF